MDNTNKKKIAAQLRAAAHKLEAAPKNQRLNKVIRKEIVEHLSGDFSDDIVSSVAGVLPGIPEDEVREVYEIILMEIEKGK